MSEESFATSPQNQFWRREFQTGFQRFVRLFRHRCSLSIVWLFGVIVSTLLLMSRYVAELRLRDGTSFVWIDRVAHVVILLFWRVGSGKSLGSNYLFVSCRFLCLW